jgi:hypothetical protein
VEVANDMSHIKTKKINNEVHKILDSEALKIHYSDLYCDNSRGQSSNVTHLSTKHFPKLTSKTISKETSITKGISS